MALSCKGEHYMPACMHICVYISPREILVRVHQESMYKNVYSNKEEGGASNSNLYHTK